MKAPQSDAVRRIKADGKGREMVLKVRDVHKHGKARITLSDGTTYVMSRPPTFYSFMEEQKAKESEEFKLTEDWPTPRMSASIARFVISVSTAAIGVAMILIMLPDVFAGLLAAASVICLMLSLRN